MKQEDIIKAINEKYTALGENPDTYLKGLLQAKPINYWDYIEVETLLSLQKPRTDFKDEKIFIMYHQVIELLLKMVRHEVIQLHEMDSVDEEIWLDKFSRLNRYVNMLITSFDIMKDGMSYEDYNIFRSTLTPASGFQSAQFRYIEIYCTKLENLVNEEGKKRLPKNPSTEDYFEHIYWRDAGYNRKTDSKTLTLRQFEEKYLDSFISLANNVKGDTLEEKFLQLENPSSALQKIILEFDKLYNVEWPLVHLNTARHYLDKKGENKTATGGSEWKKYLHPKFQQRKFFPTLWNEE
ncbi:tryptophan 2,3-dioxygenase family protein [Marixanthomonas ophiurae]|uniref:Tryptophan 2,3-dioxygenase n=1 Tax=Marixanthomonas ophiurae TaxID=387659 RepID=A0A3E1Q9L3_9FLAO|nr:tryptophan 2,3-dioxygenase family protein [Marixanthomonas ophiurae]RFN58823.1 tryptophan 2,3-dioxygenase [Marixanthomonas ophiurae]